MRIAESELIINPDGSIFHLHIRPEQLADKIILVGDPGRVAFFLPHFESIEYEGSSREFTWVTGIYKGKRITILSTGIGTDNIDIVMTELDALANIDFNTREVKSEHKALTIVRIGTCGAIQYEIPIGSYILSHYSIGFDGLLNWYSERDKITNPHMEKAFMEHMHWPIELPYPYFVPSSSKLIDLFSDFTIKGMTISAPGFYGPQGRHIRQGLAMQDMIERIESFRYDNWKITNFEMESSAIAGLAIHLGHEATTICCAIAHRYRKDALPSYKAPMEKLVKLVIDKLAK